MLSIGSLVMTPVGALSRLALETDTLESIDDVGDSALRAVGLLNLFVIKDLRDSILLLKTPKTMSIG